MSQVVLPEAKLTMEELIDRNASLLRKLTAVRTERDRFKEQLDAARVHLSAGVSARATAAEVERLTNRVNILTTQRDDARALSGITDKERAELVRYRKERPKLIADNRRLLSGVPTVIASVARGILERAERDADLLKKSSPTE